MRNCLDFFHSLSRHKVNFQKYCVYVSLNVSNKVAIGLESTSGSPLIYCLDKYLGVHVIHHRISKRTEAYLVGKVCNWLAAKKAKSLGMAGWLTLIKLVMAALPIYTMKIVIRICT